MVDILDETLAIVEQELPSVYQPQPDTSLAESIAASTKELSYDEIIADQIEQRKLRPIILAVGLIGITGTVLVFLDMRRRQSGRPR